MLDADAIDVDRAARTLAASFADDDFYRWMTPDATTRVETLTAYFADKLRDGAGEVFVSDTHSSVLVVDRITSTRQRDTGDRGDPIPVLAPYVPLSHRELIVDVFGAVDALHPSEPHLYIDVIASAPEARGQGDGSRLMAEWLAAAAPQFAYLESSNVRNLPFYRRHGFVADEVVTLPYGGLQLTPMSRRASLTDSGVARSTD
jgi:ribosomal protein S18 acetylase RimI-like enzyme